MKWHIKFWVASILCSALSGAHAAGLSTSFVDVFVKNAPVGQKIKIQTPGGKNMRLTNLGEKPVLVTFQSLSPASTQMRPGAQGLPDLSWVSYDPPTVTISPRDEEDVKMSIRIPDDPQYRGRTFQVMVWSRAENIHQNGVSYTAALLSSVRIQTLP